MFRIMRSESSTFLTFSDVDLSGSVEYRLKLLEGLAFTTECLDHHVAPFGLAE